MVGAIGGWAPAAAVAVAVGVAVVLAVAVAVGVAAADGEAGADACGVGNGDVTAEADGSGGRDGTPDAMGTGVADGVDVGAPPACSVQLVPSQVQVSPSTSPAAEVDPTSCPPKSTTWEVASSYARAGWERGAGASAGDAFTQPVAGLVETHRAPVASRPTTSPAAVSATGGASK